jgi:hypothetical protein
MFSDREWNSFRLKLVILLWSSEVPDNPDIAGKPRSINPSPYILNVMHLSLMFDAFK